MGRNTVDTAEREMKIRYTRFRHLNEFKKDLSVPFTTRTAYLPPVTMWWYNDKNCMAVLNTNQLHILLFQRILHLTSLVLQGKKKSKKSIYLFLAWDFKDLCLITTDTLTPDHSRKSHINCRTFRHHRIPSVVRGYKASFLNKAFS